MSKSKTIPLRPTDKLTIRREFPNLKDYHETFDITLKDLEEYLKKRSFINSESGLDLGNL